ncbi:MAG: TerB family tellurite resistance protein [Bacteroidia bacterium]|nr:TerB family tellurite resistance protein [Bacteroidia bacterium]
MTEQERNLTTFQNLCVMAFADGIIHENEIAILAELAGNLGLDPDIANEIIHQAPKLNFRVPENPEDCRNELRRIVLMMVTDAEIHPKEYEQCKKLAAAMHIEPDYLDKVIEFYISKQHEHIQHLAIFQNLFLVAVADGELTPVEQEFLRDVAENLGLDPEDVDYILENHQNLDFIIPEDDEEKYFSLKNLVYMMLVDGDIEQSEYQLCLDFARRVGMGRKEIEEILAEYEQMQKDRSEKQSDIDRENVDICLDIFLNLSACPYSVAEILAIGEKLLTTRLADFSTPNARCTRHLLDFFWLIYVRTHSIHRDHKQMIPLLLDLAKAQNSFQELRDHVIRLEQEHGATEIPLPNMSDETVRQELQSWLTKI